TKNVLTAAINNTAAMPININRLPGFFSSAATVSKVPKLARREVSRFSSVFGGVASGTTSIGAALLAGSTLDTTGAPGRGADGPGLITTAGGVTDTVVATIGLVAATGAGGRVASACALSSRGRPPFCSKAEIWSAMVLSTATCVIVKAC